MRVYAQPPIIIGGRQPVKPNQKPHLAEVFPQIAAPQHLIKAQIKGAIRRGENVVILGVPGSGKSYFAEELFDEFSMRAENYLLGTLHDMFEIEVESKSGLIILDDMRFYVPASQTQFPDVPVSIGRVGPELGTQVISKAIQQSKQLIITNVPIEEAFLVQLAQSLGFKVFILPSATFEEFSDSVSTITSLSLPAKSIRLIFELSGGNYRIAKEIINSIELQPQSSLSIKILAGQKLDPEDLEQIMLKIKQRSQSCLSSIQNNFTDDYIINGLIKFTFLSNNGKIPSNIFWNSFIEKQQEAVIRLLRYGILVIEKDEIKFRSPLVQQAFADFFDPSRRRSPFRSL